MPAVLKPVFEQFRSQLLSKGKPLLEKDIVPIQARVVAHLDTVTQLLVQKSRRVASRDCILEITAAWVGMDASQREAISILRKAWPGALFEDADEKFCLTPQEETVILAFAVSYPENRFLTGRLLITF